MQANVVWKQKMAFEGSAETGFTLPLDADTSVGGEQGGFLPMELIAIGLAGCTAMDVISILKKKRQELTGFEVRVAAERADEHPKVFTKMDVEYLISGRGIKEDAVQRAIELSETKYCPAQGMLAKAVDMHSTFTITNEDE